MSRPKSPPSSPLIGPPARVPRPEPRQRPPRGRTYAKPDYETTRDVDPDLVQLASEALPFERTAPRRSSPTGPPPADDDDERTAVLPEETEPKRVVVLPKPTVPPPRPSTPAPPAMLAPLRPEPWDRSAPSQPPLASSRPSRPPGQLGSASVRVPAPPPSATSNPPPPELLGPRRQEIPPPSAASVELDDPEPVPSEPPPLGLCATVAARAHLWPEQQAQALADAQLSEERWLEGCSHWDEVVTAELRRGERATLERYDQHYVAELERLRGPIEPRDHARIDEATERGAPELAFQELRLPLAGRMQIQRVWIQRWCREPALRVRYLEELRLLRTGRP